MSNHEPTEEILHSDFLYGLLRFIGFLVGISVGPFLLFLGVSVLREIYPNEEVGMLFVLIFGLIFLASILIGAAIGLALATKFYERVLSRRKQKLKDENLP
jgi:MFS family permease